MISNTTILQHHPHLEILPYLNLRRGASTSIGRFITVSVVRCLSPIRVVVNVYG